MPGLASSRKLEAGGRISLNTRLRRRSEGVLIPDIAVAVGIAILQIENSIVLRGVLVKVVASPAASRDPHSELAVVVEGVPLYVIA